MASIVQQRDHGDPATVPALHIGLLWHTAFNSNLGVGALTLANAKLIADAAERAGYRPFLHLIGSRGKFDYRRDLPAENDFTNVGFKALLNPFSSLHAMFRQCDVVFDIGGGDSFSDIYSMRRYAMIILSKLAASRGGTPLVLSPQTIGPFHTAGARRAAVAVLKRVHRAFARDEMSLRVLQDMGFADKSSLTTDVAFALPYAKPADKETRDLAAGPVRVGLNVSALLFSLERSPHKNIRLGLDYPALVDRLMERLSRDPRVELHLVAHVIAPKPAGEELDAIGEVGHWEDDYALARALKARFPDAILPPRFSSPSEAKSYIATMDLFIGSRMHATLAAISSGTAVVPLGYSRKFNGLFESLGYGRNVDLTSETADLVMERVEAALADLPQTRLEAKAANAEAQDRLASYKAFLDETMAQIGSGVV